MYEQKTFEEIRSEARRLSNREIQRRRKYWLDEARDVLEGANGSLGESQREKVREYREQAQNWELCQSEDAAVGSQLPVQEKPGSSLDHFGRDRPEMQGETRTLSPSESARDWVEGKDRADELDELKDLRFGSYVRALATGPENELEERALEVGTDTAGGHLVDEHLVAQVIDALAAQSVIFGDVPNGAGVRRIMMQDNQSDVFNFPRTDSIPSAIWHDEGVSESSQDPTFSRASANIGTLLIPIYVSRELIQDSPTIEDAIERAAIQSANAEIQGTFLGTTTTSNAPNGLQDDGSRQTVSAADAFDYDELLDLIGDVLGADGAHPTAAIEAPANAVARAKIKDGQGNPVGLPPLVRDMEFFQTTSVPTDQGGGSDETSVFVGDFGQYSGVVFRTDGVMIEPTRATGPTGTS